MKTAEQSVCFRKKKKALLRELYLSMVSRTGFEPVIQP